MALFDEEGGFDPDLGRADAESVGLSPDAAARYQGYWKQKSLLLKSDCSNEVLYEYLYKINPDKALKFSNTGNWPSEIQIPKNPNVLNNEWEIDWLQAPGGGYVLDGAGKPIKNPYMPQVDDILDRYGTPDGTYASPVTDGNPYSYNERSLPYVEDASKYHQYEGTGDFSNVKVYIDNCSDSVAKTQIEAVIKKYHGGSFDNLTAGIGEIAPSFGTVKGGVQIQLPLTIEQLERIGLLKEIK
jgi:hypothetical protein